MAANNKSKSKRMAADDSHLSGYGEIREQVATVGEDMRELARTAGQAALDRMDPVEQYVREKPLRAVLMAAGIGALIGAIFLRR